MKKEIYKDYPTCKLCGGLCCKSNAGIYSPDDFDHKITKRFILSLLNTGTFAIDWWDGDARFDRNSENRWDTENLDQTLYLRPRHKNQKVVFASIGKQECINHHERTGCILKEKDRPYQCRMLIPNKRFATEGCKPDPKDKSSKQDMAVRWIPYQHILKQAINAYEEK